MEIRAVERAQRSIALLIKKMACKKHSHLVLELGNILFLFEGVDDIENTRCTKNRKKAMLRANSRKKDLRLPFGKCLLQVNLLSRARKPVRANPCVCICASHFGRIYFITNLPIIRQCSYCRTTRIFNIGFRRILWLMQLLRKMQNADTPYKTLRLLILLVYK